ncbi:polypeptide-transport-associated shlb-type [Lucifera butyrica]|uniref:Polypeptide-transport-associated shlb-type n=1 Tax=Lucifera butyrica TaxID=1351585 RepID=A0A498REH8_9FIRM|nr:ShlB/FhaC/HecB family hemolysin secretion/activation protein [Lucifera butyrica]VBB09904.1 polypeptide-transport-associated shlb-type [Lucifera butyrica]
MIQTQEPKRSRRLWKGVLALLLLLQINLPLSYAAPSPADTEEQNRRSRQQAQEQQQRRQQKDIFLQQGTKGSEDTSLPEESPSFVVNTLQLTGDGADCFPWAQTMLNRYKGRKIGIQGINLIVKRLTNAFIDRGYITTRIVVPEQNLSGGTLKLILIPGRVGHIRFADPNVWGNWQNAFPAHPGDILNLRNLEQGLEQMKRVPSQDVTMQLVPGKQPGESDVVINVKRGKPYRFVFSIDDSGQTETGKIQMSETLAMDNLLGLNDLFNFTKSGDGDRDGDLHGTRGDSVYYSFPYQNSTFSFTSSRYHYHQTVATAQPTHLSGENDSMEFHLTQLLDRDQVSKTNLELAISKGHIRSFVEDVELENQRYDTTAFKIGLSHRHYFGQTTLDFELDNKRGVPWFGAQSDPETPGLQTTRYNMWLLDVNLTTPVHFGSAQGRYSLSFHGQYTRDLLWGTDYISIGNRYTVRGFDGEETLSADSGWYLRNELSIPVNSSGLEAYAGLDYGEVYGNGALDQNLLGRILTGAVLGVRGGTQNSHYDLFVGWPLRQPDGFVAANPTYGFQFVYQI